MFVTLLIALAALGLAIGAWFRPLPGNKPPSAEAKPTFTNQQVADAKTSVCAAFKKTDRALDLSSARDGGNDPTATLAVATSVRQVLDFSSRYLHAKLAEEPATPPDLADAVRKLANSYQEVTMGYLAGLTNSDSDLQPSLHAGDEATFRIRGLCK